MKKLMHREVKPRPALHSTKKDRHPIQLAGFWSLGTSRLPLDARSPGSEMSGDLMNLPSFPSSGSKCTLVMEKSVP